MKRFLWKKTTTFLFILIGGTLPLIYYTQFVGVSSEFDRNKFTRFFSPSFYKDDFRQYIYRTDRKIDRRAFETYSFSVEISNQIGAYRLISDTRDPKTVSVIISFYNEARSALLRTIVTVLKRTPLEYLEEIILVDDCSYDASDGEDLKFLPYVKLIRNQRREGLIRSRNKGAETAYGTYLLFLDSHCEVNEGWLEPLLDRALKHPTIAVSPVIDSIDPDTLKYKASYPFLKGGFDWNLRFKWIPISFEERKVRQEDILSFTAPAFSAGTFMISRKWFFQLGGFDSSLEIWGGESLEMSIKHWLCGGQIEVVPCSRIGHVFRKSYPYSFPDGVYFTYLRNSKRIAESWFDEYKHFFYSMKPAARDISVEPNDKVNILKKDLQCRPFSWYLATVFSELKLPNEDHIAFGQVKCGTKCLGFGVKDQTVKLQDCSFEDNSQWFLHSTTGKLSTDTGACLNLNGNQVILEYCKDSKNQMWIRRGGKLVHEATGLCLDNTLLDAIVGTECRPGAPSQLFSFSVELQKL